MSGIYRNADVIQTDATATPARMRSDASGCAARKPTGFVWASRSLRDTGHGHPHAARADRSQQSMPRIVAQEAA